MPDLEVRIAEWRRQLAAGGIKSRAVLDELESHLREDIEGLLRTGLSPQEAFAAAERRIGPARMLEAEFAKVTRTPRLPVRPKIIRLGCTFSAVFIGVVGTWTFLDGDLSPVQRGLGLLTIALTAFHLAGLGLSRRYLPAIINAGTRKAVKLAWLLVSCLWPLFALGMATQIIHLRIGFNLEALLWSLLLALMATAMALEALEFDSPDGTLIPGPFTPIAQQSLEIARAEAAGFHHDFIGTEHVLLGLLKQEDGIVHRVLGRLGVDRAIVRAKIEQVVGIAPARPTRADPPFTPRLRQALALAAREAKALHHAGVSPEHIFLGLILEDTGLAALVLKQLNVNAARTREEILKELDPGRNRG